MDNTWIKMPYTEEAIFYPYKVRLYEHKAGWRAVIETGRDSSHMCQCATKREAMERALMYIDEELVHALHSVREAMAKVRYQYEEAKP
jgi:hypothetical protein